jgi:hypothetical protein
MMTKTCLGCGVDFQASKANAKTCSPRCRQRIRKQPAGATPAPPAKVVDLPTKTATLSGIVASTRGELEACERLETSLGQLAMFAAERLEQSSRDTASSVAALMRAYREAMAAAVEGAAVEEDPIEKARRRVFEVVNGGRV